MYRCLCVDSCTFKWSPLRGSGTRDCSQCGLLNISLTSTIFCFKVPWSIFCSSNFFALFEISYFVTDSQYKLFRYAFRERAREEIAKRPSWRAIERTIGKDGLKTVFVLRLSPLLPIPIGAYNYLYGAMPVTISDFIIGLSAASTKPYFLDSYLGVYGKSIMDGNGAQNDLLFGAVLFVLILVGMSKYVYIHAVFQFD